MTNYDSLKISDRTAPVAQKFRKPGPHRTRTENVSKIRTAPHQHPKKFQKLAPHRTSTKKIFKNSHRTAPAPINPKNIAPTRTDRCAHQAVRGSLVVSIPACHAGDRGSIPRRGAFF